MAHTTLFVIPAIAFVGDENAQLVAGDEPAYFANHLGRNVLVFEDTNEKAAVSSELVVPAFYAAGTLSADIHFYMASDVTNDIAIDFYVEAKTPDTDTLDLEAASSWGTLNSGTKSLASTTAGDPLILTITLTNKDSIAAGDLVRFGIRRDTDSANDDAVGNMYVPCVEIWETT